MDKKNKSQNLTLVPPVSAIDAIFLECEFHGIEESLIYPVGSEDSDRIHSIFSSGLRGFLAIETLDDRAVYLSLDHLQNCRIDMGDHIQKGPKIDSLICQLLGTGAIEISDVKKECLADIKLKLNDYEVLDGGFVMVSDQTGTTTAINMHDIVIIEFPLSWHEISTEIPIEKKTK